MAARQGASRHQVDRRGWLAARSVLAPGHLVALTARAIASSVAIAPAASTCRSRCP